VREATYKIAKKLAKKVLTIAKNNAYEVISEIGDKEGRKRYV